MHIFSLSLSLLWRTVVVYLLLAVPTLLVLFLLSLVGLDPRPNDIQAAATYIKAKPTLIYVAFAAALAISERWLHINLHRLLWGSRLQLTKNAWRTVAIWLSLLLLAMAGLNAAVAALASVDAWVTYKLFGALSILVLGHFVLARHVLAPSPR